MAYSPPSGNVTTATGMFQWVNSTVDNWFFPGFIIAFYIIMLVKMLSNPSNTASNSFAAASFICMIICIMARVLNFISTGFLSIFIVLTIMGALWMHKENA